MRSKFRAIGARVKVEQMEGGEWRWTCSECKEAREGFDESLHAQYVGMAHLELHSLPRDVYTLCPL